MPAMMLLFLGVIAAVYVVSGLVDFIHWLCNSKGAKW